MPAFSRVSSGAAPMLLLHLHGEVTRSSCSLSAPMTASDSKSGTPIHETRHVSIVAGTHSRVSGQSSAKSLAITEPARALDDAESPRSFAEDTPFHTRADARRT